MKKIMISFMLSLGLVLQFLFPQQTFAANDKYLNKIQDNQDIQVSSVQGKESIYEFTLDIAEAIKVIFFVAALVYFMIITIKLMVSNNTEEELSNFKKGLIWISVGIILINVAHVFVKSIYDQNLSLSGQSSGSIKTSLEGLSKNILENIIIPFIHILEFAAAFFFIIIMIFSFFRLITANGNDESAKTGKMTVFYAIIGFIVVKIASALVFAVYSKCGSTIAKMFGQTCSNTSTNLTGFAKIIFDIINWLNSFVAVAVIILIIFIGAQIIFSNGDDEKITKARKSLIYIVVGIAILLFNYLILTFFFNI